MCGWLPLVKNVLYRVLRPLRFPVVHNECRCSMTVSKGRPAVGSKRGSVWARNKGL